MAIAKKQDASRHAGDHHHHLLLSSAGFGADSAAASSIPRISGLMPLRSRAEDIEFVSALSSTSVRTAAVKPRYLRISMMNGDRPTASHTQHRTRKNFEEKNYQGGEGGAGKEQRPSCKVTQQHNCYKRVRARTLRFSAGTKLCRWSFCSHPL